MLVQEKKYINKDKRKGKREGWAALNLASFNDHKEIVELLLQDNSIEIIHQTNDGKTALMLASSFRVVKKLCNS